ncbi:MAG: EamA family transporter [Tepidimonas fonticaldi]|nr:EamA family transporter [Tepidimonas fonticaldi]
MQTFSSPAVGRWRLLAALSIVYIVWGTTYYALGVAMRTLPPVLMNGARFLIAGAVMLALAQWRGQAWPTRREWAGCALIGTLMAFAAMALVVLAQHQGIGSGLMATVVTTMPMWLALWTRLGGERVPGTSWAGLALGAVGAGLLALEGDFGATPLGALFAFAAPLCWSIGSYASRRLALPAPAMASGAQWLIGGAVGVAVAWLAEPGARSVDWSAVTPASWLAWGYLVVMGTLVTLNCYLWLLHHTSVALAGSYSFVNPLVALAIGVGLGGERVTGWVFVAMPLILGGLALIAYGPALLAVLRRAVLSVAAGRLQPAGSSGSSAP